MSCCNRHKNKNKHIIPKIPDKLRDTISTILPDEKPNNTMDRPVIPYSKVMDDILFMFFEPDVNSGKYSYLVNMGSGSSTYHRRFQQWVQLDIFKKIWIKLSELYDNKKGIKLTWQSIGNISINWPLECEDRK